jgi:hypothetical protein
MRTLTNGIFPKFEANTSIKLFYTILL